MPGKNPEKRARSSSSIRGSSSLNDPSSSAYFKPHRSVEYAERNSDDDEEKEFKKTAERAKKMKLPGTPLAIQKSPSSRRSEIPARTYTNNLEGNLATLKLSDLEVPPQHSRNQGRSRTGGEPVSGSKARETQSSPRPMGCFKILSGTHYKLEKYSQNVRDEERRGTYHYRCQISRRCHDIHLTTVNEIENHIRAQHTEDLCGYIGNSDARKEHVRVSPCYDGSRRRKDLETNTRRAATVKEKVMEKDILGSGSASAKKLVLSNTNTGEANKPKKR
ncbi:hypothetical protein SBOR_2702 [Sclerotinia borealis F-4128]|uniref:Uncharacterized protein n=1 Tax=Sclerotinia borealis (strain F-4128) TaxID=1432307 RepID=W9CLL6_SCLBF|nr:hypothetical protein SBOR_2702 [Sclerotinia borealis F-4128]